MLHSADQKKFCFPRSTFLYLPSIAPSPQDVRKAQVLKDEGNALVKKGQYQKAVEKYSQSLKLNPTEITTLTNRSVHATAVPSLHDSHSTNRSAE